MTISADSLQLLVRLIPALGVVGVLTAIAIYFGVRRQSAGTEAMRKIAEKIHDGAFVFLRREYQIIAAFVVVIFFVLALTPGLGLHTAHAFVAGAVCSMVAGFLGMKAATRAAVRTCQGARDGGIERALAIAFSGGAVMGIMVAALGVVGLGLYFLFTQDPRIINGFAMGASLVALFARVGGGVYTKSADVGADLVGKIEAGIPEDDPRNPGVIADNVGDIVGDTAGMGADLFESYLGSVVATMAIAAATMAGTDSYRWMALPLVLIALGLVASLVGIGSIRLLKKISPESALRYGFYVAAFLFAVGAWIFSRLVVGTVSPFWAVLSGIVAGMLIAAESEYYASGPPIRKVARAGETGPATNVITGLATGYESVILPILTLVGAMFMAYTVGGGVYGIAIAAVGMLSTVGMVVSVDSYGPIADNAGGLAEMSGADPAIRRITDRLDALGNTTAAIAKGFAIGSAALTALALFSAYQLTVGLAAIDLLAVRTVMGLLLGAMMPFVIASTTMKAVGRTANKMVVEIRRQFREIAGLMDGTAEPETDKCIDIVTRAALREMILPGSIALAAPLAVGFGLGPEALGGFLAGATATGVLTGLFMANAGATFDNAKKWIEQGNLDGKGTPVHAAAVVGDTVGDPLKDTSGPSMNILIKLMSVVALVFAPLMLS